MNNRLHTTGSDGKIYNYDFENHLSNQNGGGVTIVYDGDGNRVAKAVGGVTARYLIDDRNHTGYAQVLEEVVGGVVQRRYTYGLDLISQNQTSGVSFYGYDGHGSVRFLTDVSGNVTDTYTYEAFGNLIRSTGSTTNNYLYAGEQNDPNVGFYYLRARYLNPAAGRFITSDDVPGSDLDPPSLHRYTYASNNPATFVDPSGQLSTIVELGISSAISGIIQASFIWGREDSLHRLFEPKNLTEIGIAVVAGAVGSLAAKGISVGLQGLARFYGTHFVRYVLPNTTAALAASITSEFLRFAVLGEPVEVKRIAFATFMGVVAGGFIVAFHPRTSASVVVNARWSQFNVSLGSRPLVGTGGVVFQQVSDILWEAFSTAAEEKVFS